MEILAEQLYQAVTELLHDNKVTGLLAAVGDAKVGVPFDKAAPATRRIFLSLAANLTRAQG